jgi:hypothetical protein
VDDSVFIGTLGGFGSAADTDFAIEFVFQTSQAASLITVINSGTTALQVRTDSGFNGQSGKLTVALRGDSGGLDFMNVDSPSTITDGTPHHVIWNKTGNTASDMELFIDGQSTSPIVGTDAFVPSSIVDFDTSVTYFSQNNDGSTTGFIEAEMPLVRWYNDSISQVEKQELFTQQPYV